MEHRNVTRTTVWPFVLAAAAGLTALLVAASHGASPRSEVTVAAREFSFSPARISARRGQILVLRVGNVGKQEHDFLTSLFRSVGEAKVTVGGVVVEGEIDELELPPGAEAVVELVPRRAGTFPFWCSVLYRGRPHRDLGMRGVIQVSP